MVQVIVTHDVDDVDLWFNSPERQQFFGARGMTATAFRDPSGESSSVAVLIEAPDMQTLQAAIQTPEASAAEARDGVHVDTLKLLVDA